MEFQPLRSLSLILLFKPDLHSDTHDHHVENRASLVKDDGSVAIDHQSSSSLTIKFDPFPQ